MARPSYESREYGLSEDFLALLHKMEKLPHFRRRLSLSQEQPRKPFFYKYLDFSSASEFSIKKARDLIIDNRLYMARPSEFNDPNEFRAKVRATSDPVARRKWLERSAKKVHRRHGLKHIGTGRQVNAMVRERFAALQRNPNLLSETVENLKDKYGISCFASNARSNLMWAHYGRGHRGICLQFERTRCVGFLGPAPQVSYRTNLPEIVWPDEAERILDAILSKSNEWSYEGEHRVISQHVSGDYLKFDGDSLSGIILGQRFEECPEDVATLRVLLETRARRGLRSPKIYRAVRSQDAYSLSCKRIELCNSPT